MDPIHRTIQLAEQNVERGGLSKRTDRAFNGTVNNFV